jgi:F-type H+-transporting ATPase subunit b
MSRRTLALAALVAASLPAVALAEGGGGPGESFYVYLVDFLILFIPVAWLVWPRARQALADRHDAMKAELDDARTKFAESEARMKTAEERLTVLNDEMNTVMEEFRRQGQAERDALAHEGVVLSEKIRAEADFRMDQAVKMARADLAEAVVTKAFALVEGRLAAKSGAALPEGVVDRVVREVGNKPS